jgi:hypothetical protein
MEHTRNTSTKCVNLSEGARQSAGSICVIRQSKTILGAILSGGRTIWIADAHRDDGKRFVVHADEQLTAFVELELAIRDKESRSHRPC